MVECLAKTIFQWRCHDRCVEKTTVAISFFFKRIVLTFVSFFLFHSKEACFDCLPPYAASLAMAERNTYSRFLNALRQGYLPISQQTLQDDSLVKWAFNVALTRFNEVWEPRRQKLIAPLGDMVRFHLQFFFF